MMKSMIKILSIAALIVAASGAVESARAEGFLTGVARKAGVISKKQAKAIDKVHKNLGRPVDRAGAAVADYYAPGLGMAWTAQDELKRGGR